MNKYIILSLTFIGIAFLIFLGEKTGKQSKPDLTESVFQVSACKPQEQACKLSHEKFKAEIVFDKNIVYLKPFKVTVRAEEKEPHLLKAVIVDFKMKSMDMGVNRFTLNRNKTAGSIVNWKGTALLPVCVTGRIDWYSEVEFIAEKKKYVYTFPMEVKKPDN